MHTTALKIRARPALAAYLIAVGMLPFKWLSPLHGLNDRAILADVVLAAAAALWLLEKRSWRGLRVTPVHACLAVFAVIAAGSAAASSAPGSGVGDVLLIVELVVLAALTWEFATLDEGAFGIRVVIAAGVIGTAAVALVGLGMFYAGVHTSAVGNFRDLEASANSARVAAGFFSAPLLGSWCVFASAVLAWRVPRGWPRRLGIALEVLLIGLVVVSISRAIIAFAVALVLRWGWARGPGPRRWALAATGAAVALIASLSIGQLHLDPVRPWDARYTLEESSRRELLRTGWEAAVDHPVLGEGPGALPARLGSTPYQAHLTAVDVAATLGFPALLVLAALVAILWRARSRPTEIALWAGFAGLMIESLGQNVSHFRHVWVMLGLLAATSVLPALGTPER